MATPAGSAAAAVTVTMLEHPNGYEQFFGAAAGLFSAGLFCFVGDNTCFGGGERVSTTTDGAGRFHLDLKSDTSGNSYTLAAASPPPGQEPTGPGITFDFRPSRRSGVVPPMRLWDTPLRISTRAQRLQFEWAPLPADRSASPRYRVLLTQANRLLLSLDQVGSGLTLDDRQVEDATVTVLLTATGPVAAEPGIRGGWRPTPVRVKGSAGAPLSRGKPCTAAGGSRPGRAPCTDGDLATPVDDGVVCPSDGPPATGCRPPVSSLQVDLGRAQTVGQVVARNCGSCPVETSIDGTNWATFIRDADGVSAASTDARYVRLSPTGATDYGRVAELSVWPPRAGASTPTSSTPSDAQSPTSVGDDVPTPTTVETAAGPAGTDDADDPAPLIPLAIAAGLILGIGGYLLYSRTLRNAADL